MRIFIKYFIQSSSLNFRSENLYEKSRKHLQGKLLIIQYSVTNSSFFLHVN